MDVKTIKIEDIGLSNRAFNVLHREGVVTVGDMLMHTEDSLLSMRNLGKKTLNEIISKIEEYQKYDSEGGLSDNEYNRERETPAPDMQVSIIKMLYSQEYHDRILQYVQANDCDVEFVGFSARTMNCLKRNGFHAVSDIIFLQRNDLQELKGMGSGSLQEIQSFLDDYLIIHESRVKAFCNGDDSVLWTEEAVKKIILDTYNRIGFQGLSLSELREKSNMPEQVSDTMLKSILGGLLADGKLEYVDFHYYRIYPKFTDYLKVCTSVKERNRDIILRRLKGETLENIAGVYDMTRERVRQIVSKDLKNVRNAYSAETGMDVFHEDYYRYFYETYCFDKKDAESWLGISKDTIGYLELTGAEKGTKELQQAVEDSDHLDYGFRLRIKSYLNRDKLFLDGRWIEKKR